MLPALSDLEAMGARVVGGIDADDEPRAQAALDDASALVRYEAGLTWVDASDVLDDDIPDIVVTITLAVAIRAFLNPADGVTSEQIDGYSAGYNAGGLYLTKAEKAALNGLPGAGTPGLTTLATTRSDDDYRGLDTADVIDDRTGWPVLTWDELTEQS